MNIENQLRVEIASELEELHKMELGSEEYKATVDGVTKLVDRAIEMEKLNNDIQEKDLDRETDKDLREKALNDERHDRWVRNAISVLSIGVPAAVTIWGTFKTIEFEKEGILTTFAGRSFFGRLFPKK